MDTVERQRTEVGANASHYLLPNPPRGHMPYLDGWRGICILLVLVGHLLEPLKHISVIGVEFFFALSGRLMAEILVQRQMPVSRFLQRRVSRILPAVLFYVVAIGLLLNIMQFMSGSPLNLLSPFAALAFFHNYIPFSQVSSLFEHFWSLAVEEHAYLLLAIIAAVTARKRTAVIAIALGICLLCYANGFRLSQLPIGEGQYPEWRSDVRVASVLLPFALFLLARGISVGPWARRWLAATCAATAMIAVFFTSGVGLLTVFPFGLLAAIAVVSLDQTEGWARKLLENPLLGAIGTLSFSLYIWQQLFYAIAIGAGLAPALLLPLTFGAALYSYHRVERPARTYLNAWFERRGNKGLLHAEA